MQFDCREDAIIWICNNQKGRRNLTSEQKCYLRGKEYDAVKIKQGTNNQHVQKSEKRHNAVFHNTAVTMAKKYNVDRRTIQRDADYAEGVDAVGAISPEARQIILSGKSGLSKKEVGQLTQKSKDELAALTHQIEVGEHLCSVTEPLPQARQNMEEEAKSIRRHVAELKDTSIDRSYTAEYYLIEYAAFTQRFINSLEGYNEEPYKSLDAKLSVEERGNMVLLNKSMMDSIDARVSKLQRS